MLNFEKRITKIISTFLASVMVWFALMPTAAFAYYPYHNYYNYGYYGYHRHHHRHDSWTKKDTAALAGIAAVVGLLALVNNNKSKTPPSDPVSYVEYRDKYVAKLNSRESYVCNKLLAYPAGEYKTPYTQEATVKFIKQLCKKLPKDFKFVGTRTVRFTDDSTKNYIYFNRLQPVVYNDAGYSAVVVE
ncbi:MAG: hypothetical protein IJ223_01895 [Clostridia bacterium]|nr:hypothetical protein [Clostridia bacterium]